MNEFEVPVSNGEFILSAPAVDEWVLGEACSVTDEECESCQ